MQIHVERRMKEMQMNIDSKQFKNYCIYVYSSNYFCILDSSTEVLKLFETAPPFMIATEPYKSKKFLGWRQKKSSVWLSVLDFSTTIPKSYCSLKDKVFTYNCSWSVSSPKISDFPQIFNLAVWKILAFLKYFLVTVQKIMILPKFWKLGRQVRVRLSL